MLQHVRCEPPARPVRNSLVATRWGRLLALLALLLSSTGAWAQLTGPKTIPGSYASLAAAITDLNAQGVGAGGVTFSIAAGYTETFASPTAGAITATGTSASPIVFQKAGSGANPVISAGVGTSTTADAIISLAGSDYVTFNGIDLLDPTSNATATTGMEFGFLLGRVGTGATLDGTNNNTIQNSTITLQRAYTSTTNNTPYGIFSTAGTVAVPFTALSATSATAAGQSSGNAFLANTIQNVNGGIFLQGLNDATPYANYDQNNTVGGGSAVGNTIQNYGGAATAAYGIRLQYQNNVVASGNNVANAAAGGVAGASTLYGIYAQSGTNNTTTANRNTITLVQAANGSQVAGIYNATTGTGTLTIDANTFSTTSTASTGSFYNAYNSGSFTTTGATVVSFSNNIISHTATGAASNTFYGFYNSGTIAGTTAVVGNTFQNAANTVNSTGTLAFWYNTNSSTGPINFQNNQWSLNRTGASGSVYGYYNGSSPTGTHTFSGNTFSNITLAGSSTFYGFYVLTTSSQPQSVTGNTVTSVVGGSGTTAPLYIAYGASGSVISGNTVTGISGTGTTYGIYTGTSFYGGNVNGNTVGNVSSAGASSTVAGLYLGANTATTATAVNAYTNKVYGIASTGATGLAYGIYVSSTGAYNFYNNLIGGITATASSSGTATAGIYLSSGTTVTASFNTIYLAGTSSASGFGSAGIYASTTPTLTLLDNIVVNNSTATGAGIVAAYRRSSTTLTTYAAASNNNLFYGGTPGTTQAIFTDGTNTYPTLAAYKTAMATRDQASVTELPTFASLTGTDATFLHFVAGASTQAESGGTPVAGITTDYDGDTRNATTPDIGADEGTFAPAVAIVVTGTTYTQNNTPTFAGQANQQVTGVVVATTGQNNGPTLSSITFNVGSTTLSNISNAKLYSSGSSTFAVGSSTLLATTGSIAAPTFTLTLTTPVPLASGNNYFFLTYDIPASATAGATVASTATSVTIGGTTYTPTLSGPAGSRTIVGPLSGTYYVTGTVGSSPDPTKEFATLTAAAAAYNSRGLASAVTFVLRDATYSTAETFPITFGNNSSASATNTLTIQPGVTSTISGSNTTALLVLSGANYVTVNGSLTSAGTTRDLTLSNAGSGGAVVQVVSAGTGAGATNNTLKNLNLLASALTSGIGIAAGGATAGSSGADNDNLTIQNNSIQQAYVGIYVGGSAATSAGGTDGLSIVGNTIGGATSGPSNVGNAGLFVANAVAPSITGNTIQNIGLGTAAVSGLTIGATFPTGVSNATVTGNTITGVVVNAGSYDALGLNLGTGFSGVVDRNRVLNVAGNTSTYGGHGIDINTGTATSALRVSNNFVAGINGSGWTALTSDAIAGIRVLGTTGGVGLYYNSVNLSGSYSAVSTSAYISAALYVASGATALDIRNNVFANSLVNGTSTSKAYSFYSAAATAALKPIDYNDYFVSGTQGVLAYFGSADVTTLAALATADGQDARSINADPVFATATDLHTTAVALNNVGTPITGVTTDIDGDVRSTTTPDLGADEFTPQTNDLAAAGLVTPATTTACYGTAETVSVSIRNAGAAALDFSVNAATVSVVVTLPGGGTVPLTTTLTTGTLASAATQTVVLPGTLNMSTVGTYSFAITATVVGDGNTANDLLTPSPTRTVLAPVAGTLAPAASSICVSGTASLTLTGAANGTIQYQSSPDGTTFTDIAGATSATYTTPVLTSTTYYRVQVRCNTGTATSNVSTITVNNPLVATTNGPVTICSGSTATVTATASAGSSIRFFDVPNGGTALASTTAGSYTTPALTAGATYYAEAYSGSTETAGKPTSAQTYGGYSGTNTGIVFTTTGALTLQSATVYNATATAGSMSVDLVNNTTGTIITTVGPFAIPAGSTTTLIPTVLPLNLAVPGAGTYRLVTSSTPTPPTLYRDSGGNVYPYTSPSGAISVTGGYIGAASTSYYFFYNIQSSTECTGATRTPIQVNVTQPATASFPVATTSICSTSAYQLAGTVGGGATTGTYTTSGTGTFSPNATTLGATYTPSAADVTAGSVTITLTATATPCAPATATLTININRAPVATFSYPTAAVCAGSTGTLTPTLGTGATAGTFTASPAGLAINATTGVISLATSTAGTYTVTNTVAGAGTCSAATATATVTISPATTATFSYAGASFCQTGTNPTPTITGTAGGTFTATPAGLTLNATTGVITLSTSTLGTYTVTYTVAGTCGSSATATVAVTAGQSAAFTYPATTTYCAGSASTVTPTVTGANGTFTASPAGLTISATTGVITLSSSTAGTYTVTNTVAASGGCAAATATATVTITPATTATFSYSGSPFCVSGTTNPVATVTGTTGGTFTSTTGLAINATTGTINLATSLPGTYTVTYTVAGACGSSRTQTVTINAAPTATFSYATPAGCAGATATATPTLGVVTTAGTFTASPAGLTINAGTGVINLATSTAGTYTVTNTVAASGGCAAATATATFTVNPTPATPTLTASGTPAGGITLTSSSATGNQFYLNGVLVPGATGQTYLINSGTRNGSYTVVVTGVGGCTSAASAPVSVTVTATAPASAGTSLTVYPNPTPTGLVTLELTGYRLATQLTVLDALGRVVATELLPANSGTATHTLDLKGLATGVYLLRLSNADGVETRRLTRE